MDMQDEKYQQKSKSISSAEPNYFVHLAMRYPVSAAIVFGLKLDFLFKSKCLQIPSSLYQIEEPDLNNHFKMAY